MCTSGRGQVLIPWPNRLEDGSYEFDGRRAPAPAHRAGRAATRSTASSAGRAGPSREREPDRVVLEHVLHPQPGYPFALALAIEYSLSSDGLTVRTTATNVGPARARSAAARIRT